MNGHVSLLEPLELSHEIRKELLLLKRTLQWQLGQEFMDLDEFLVKVRMLQDLRQTRSSGGLHCVDMLMAVLLEFTLERRVHLGMHLENVIAQHRVGELFQALSIGLHFVLLVHCLLIPLPLGLFQELRRQLALWDEELKSRQLPVAIVSDVDRGQTDIKVPHVDLLLLMEGTVD